MDPVSAAGLASSILTFVDFSWKIVHGTYDTYQSASGLSSDHTHLDHVVQDLHNATKALQCDVDPSSPHAQALKAMANDCKNVSGELIQVLQTLERKDGNKLWRSLQTTWDRMRKDKEVRAITERLSEYRAQILLRLNLIMRDQLSAITTRQEEMQRQGLRLPEEDRTRLSDIQQSIAKLAKDFEQERYESIRVKDDEASEQSRSLDVLRDTLTMVIAELRNIPTTTTADNVILKRLYLNKSDAREHQIDPAEYGTFEWLVESKDTGSAEQISSDIGSAEYSDSGSEHYSDAVSDISSVKSTISNASPSLEETETQRLARESFSNWLRSGSGVFHISGKAGSGKSTLMKLVCRHERVEQELKHWAGEQSLVIATFFFWASGNKQQKSLDGLYQSLLHEILQKCPELIRAVFPQEWESVTANSDRIIDTPFSLPELKCAMEKLVTKSLPTHRFCFFIDGLDEYHGDSTDHLRLARELAKRATSPDIKICASSRPHLEFLETYGHGVNPTLHLHEVTAADIWHFAHKAIVDEVPEGKRLDDIDELVGEVTDSADGVFLWARLVTRSILEGMRHGDSTLILLEKLRHMPPGLEALFDQLFNSVNPADRRRSDKILLLATINNQASQESLYQKPMNALCYSWIDDLSDPGFPLNAPIRALSDDEVHTRLEYVRRQLRILTKGLLEVHKVHPIYQSAINNLYDMYEVDFHHRSVEDYLRQPGRMSEMSERLSDFDCLDALRRIRLATYKFSAPLPEELTRSFSYAAFRGVVDFMLCHPKPPLSVRDGMFLGLAEEHHKVYRHLQREAPLWARSLELPMVMPPGARPYGDKEFSYVHCLAFYGNWVYLKHLLPGNPSLLTPADEILATEHIHQRGTGLSLLLSTCTLQPHPTIVEGLLQRGASPNHRVLLRPRTVEDNPILERQSIWALFLHFFVGQIQQNSSSLTHSLRLSNERAWFLILEMFLKAGAEGDCLVSFASNISTTNYRIIQYSTTMELPDKATFALESLVLKLRPQNMEAILQLLSPTRSYWPWQTGLTKAITSMSLRTNRSWHQEHSSISHQVDLDDVLGNSRWIVEKVSFRDNHVKAGFSFRLY